MSAAPPRDAAAIAPGYEVIERLSRGRRLDVYDAWSTERGCRCIVKTLRPERAEDAGAREQLLREGRLLESLAHPHLVRAYEVLAEPAPAVVLETLGGQTLAHLVASGERPNAAETAHLILHLGSALRYLHRAGFLHLDLKPANVIAEAGRAKLIDLSLARPPGPAPAGAGTPDFMAPEQARGGEPLGPAADVWGIGVIAYELASGERPFGDGDPEDSGSEGDGESWTEASWESADGEADDDTRYLQLEGPAPASPALRELDPELDSLVMACLEPDPADRPALAEVLARAERLTGVPPEQARWQPPA